jgi:hypothetical protein
MEIIGILIKKESRVSRMLEFLIRLRYLGPDEWGGIGSIFFA